MRKFVFTLEQRFHACWLYAWPESERDENYECEYKWNSEIKNNR